MNEESLPFELVEKEDRRTPLRELSAHNCSHERAYIAESETFASNGADKTYICADCGRVTSFPRDLA